MSHAYTMNTDRMGGVTLGRSDLKSVYIQPGDGAAKFRAEFDAIRADPSSDKSLNNLFNEYFGD